MPVADWEPIDWRKRFDVKQARQAKTAQAAMIQAETARMRAGTEATREERLYSPTGLRQQELSRRFPYGVPERAATTARIKATSEAETGAGALGLERERFEFAKGYFAETGELPGRGRERDDVSAIRRIAGEEEEEGVARVGGAKCPRGHRWDGRKCVPLM